MTVSYIDVDELRHVLFDYSKGKDGRVLVSREQLEEFIIQAEVREE